jgi:hypothetical protein
MLKLNAAGKMVAKVFTNLSEYYSAVLFDTYIVMPDHFHGIIIIDHPVGVRLPPDARPKTRKWYPFVELSDIIF